MGAEVEETELRRVELKLAEAARDLLPAIEAAQYARLVDHAEPADDAEAAAIGLAVETFLGAAETWDELTPLARERVLAQLGDHLDGLDDDGLFVHWGVVTLALGDGGGRPRQLPLAILSIDRLALPTIEVALPAGLALDAGGGTLH
jgi:hypothetical protein